jgi:hypothetical protein
MVQKRAICQRGVLWAFISVMFTPPGPSLRIGPIRNGGTREGKLIKANDPAVVPGVINHRGGWWLRWDSITVSQLLRPAHSSTRGRMSANRNLDDDIARGVAKRPTPHPPSRRTHLAKVVQGKEPWT